MASPRLGTSSAPRFALCGPRSRFIALALLACGGCSALLKFHECDVNSDCMSAAGGPMLYCTSDHMCVNGLPDDQLCKQSVPSPGTPIPDGALVVAGLYRLTSVNGVNDHAIRWGADLAALQLSSEAGVNVVHYACDTGGDPAQAARAFKLAVTELHAVATIGPDTSDEVVKGVAPLVTQYSTVVVSPSATAPLITSLPDNGLIWRTAPSDILQAKVLVSLVPSNVKLDLVYVDKDTYASGLEQAFTTGFTGAISKTVVFPTGSAGAAVGQMDAPGYALLIADDDDPPLVAALENAPGQAMTQYLMTDAAQRPQLWGPANMRIGWPMLNRIRGTAPGLPADPDPSAGVYRGFSTDYQAHFGEDPSNTAWVANAYDAFYVVAIAAAVAGPHPTGVAIAANMRRLSDKSAKAIAVGVNGYGAAVQALQASPGATVDLYGASGPIDFDPATGDILSAPIEVWKIVMAADGNPTFAAASVVTP
jgi:ABC-type branched-subunit amino acid transport system substrate-binding protein